MKSRLFTDLIQIMDRFDNQLCRSEDKQIQFIESFVLSSIILRSHQHMSHKGMSSVELENYHGMTMIKRLEFILNTLEALADIDTKNLEVTAQDVDGNIVCGIKVGQVLQ